MSYEIPEIEGQSRYIYMKLSRFDLDPRFILKAITNCTGYPPISLRKGLNQKDKEKELLVELAIYFSLEYTNFQPTDLAQYFNVQNTDIERIGYMWHQKWHVPDVNLLKVIEIDSEINKQRQYRMVINPTTGLRLTCEEIKQLRKVSRKLRLDAREMSL